jgi:SAM-dependent methyltransferase
VLVSDDGYLLANAQVEAGSRFAALSQLFDPWTQRHLLDAGLSDGWRCWEIGAGGPSLPTWLAERVGPSGRVVASDIDPSWLGAGEGYEVVRHDIAVDDPPGEFDLIHARLVLVHVPQRREVIGRLAAALRPRGVLVLEEADPALQPLLSPDESSPAAERANRLRNGFRALMAERGVDLAFGRTLPRLLREAELRDVRADAYFPITGPACAVLERATVLQIRDRLLAAGLATEAEIEQHLAAVDAGELDLATAPLISASGRRSFS